MKIFVNGTFDVIHPGHLDLLHYAKSLGDFLLVAIDSDTRVASKKGKDRPLNPEYNRAMLLSALKDVDNVRIFDTDEELVQIIKKYQPDVMVVGSDWKDKPVIGSEYVKRLEFYSRTTAYSTTKILENFIARR